MSEGDVMKLELLEHLDYNLDILFASILMHPIWQTGASENKKKKKTFSFHHERVFDLNFHGLLLELEK